MEVLGMILVIGTAVLLSLGFVFVSAFMVRGIFKAIRGEQILPTEIGPEETKRLLEVEKAARNVLEDERGEKSATILSLAVSIHELDATRDNQKIKELEKTDERKG